MMNSRTTLQGRSALPPRTQRPAYHQQRTTQGSARGGRVDVSWLDLTPSPPSSPPSSSSQPLPSEPWTSEDYANALQKALRYEPSTSEKRYRTQARQKPIAPVKKLYRSQLSKPLPPLPPPTEDEREVEIYASGKVIRGVRPKVPSVAGSAKSTSASFAGKVKDLVSSRQKTEARRKQEQLQLQRAYSYSPPPLVPVKNRSFTLGEEVDMPKRKAINLFRRKGGR